MGLSICRVLELCLFERDWQYRNIDFGSYAGLNKCRNNWCRFVVLSLFMVLCIVCTFVGLEAMNLLEFLMTMQCDPLCRFYFMLLLKMKRSWLLIVKSMPVLSVVKGTLHLQQPIPKIGRVWSPCQWLERI